MKKFLFIMTLLIAFCVPWAHGQTLFYEGFESTTGSSLPTGWTNEGTKAWTTAKGVNTTHPSTAYQGNRNAQLNAGARDYISKLITPVIDCSSKSSVILTFAYVNESWSGDIDEIRVYYRTSTSDSWHQIDNITSGHTSWTLSEEYAISTSLSSTLQLAFECYSHWGYGVGIDEVKVVPASTCSPLQSLYASDVTRTSITANWAKKAAATNCVGYEVKLSSSDNPDDAGVSTATIDNPATTSYVFSNLERNTTYYLHARPNCGEEDGYGEWISASVTTKSLNDCSYAVTVADGTSQSEYIPVYGGYCDENQKTQSIYPASMLTQLVGKSISKLKYEVTDGGSSSWSSAVFQIRMKIVEASTLSGTLPTTDATLVYTGTLSASTSSGMEINLSTPFTYNGGNLLIEFNETQTSYYGTCKFKGTSVSSASYLANVGYGAGSYSFLPKVDFGYCETLEACPAVTNVAVSDIAQTTANLSWTASTGDYANTYDVLVSTTPVEDFTDVVPTYSGLDTCGQELTSLTQYTDYYVYVRVNCDGNSHDDGEAWSEAVQFKTLSNCITPTDFTVTVLTKTSAKAQWTATSQASNYRYILSTEELTDPDLETVTASGITGNNVLLNHLTPGETYYLYLSNACGGDDGNSPYIDTTFTMPEACIAPTEMNITDVQKYQMTLNWTPSQYAEDGDAYDIYVSDAEILDFTGVEPTYTGVTGTSKVIDLLQRNTTYYVYLRGNCGEGAVTDWSEAVSATTLGIVPDCNDILVGTSTTSGNMPVTNYDYAYTQMIYTADNFDNYGNIGSIKLRHTLSYYEMNNMKVYLGTTTKSTFSSKSDWVPESDLTLVYDGSFATDPEWLELELIQPFTYDGSKNLVVAISNGHGTWNNIQNFYYTSTANTVLTRRADGNPSYANHPGNVEGESPSSERTNIKFNICTVAEICPTVEAPVASDVTNTEATITWNAGTGDFASSYDLVVSATPVEDFTGVTLAADDVTETSFDVTGLAANTHYYTYVRVNCVNDIYNDGSSVWSPAGEFTTELPCLKPENFVAGSPLSDRVELSWIKKGTAADWRIYVDTFDVEYTAWLPADTVFVNAADCQIAEDTVTYLITGLQPEKGYTFALQADCGEVDDLSKLAIDFPNIYTLSDNTEIDTMTISSTEVFSTTINRAAKTIDIVVRKGSDLEAMYGNITLNHYGAQVRVNSEDFTQPWNLSAPVTVTVLAQDTNVTADWTITVAEEACATPFNVAATDIERRTANLNWNIGDASTSFNFVISETELEDPATGTIQNITATNVDGACTYAVTGLTRGTHYYVYLRTNCGETFGQWRGTDFTTKSLLVCDDSYTLSGYNNNTSSLPVYGYYANMAERTQSIYPASELTSLVGKKISALKYFVYSGTNAGYWDMAPFTVKVAETSATSLSSAFVDTEMTTVYTGTLTANTTDNMVVNFDTPFEYNGGNLLIEFSKESGYYSNSVSFYAKYATSGSSRYKYSYESSSSYLPRIEFTLCEETNACPEVTNVAIDNIAETSATVTWTESTGDYANESDIYYSTNPDTTGVIAPMVTGVTGNSAEITGLENYTTYYVWVRTHCDGEGQDDGISPWAGGTSFRTLSPCRVPGTPVPTVTGKHTATVTWANTSEGTQADNFTYILSATPIAEADLETAEATESAYNDTTVDLTGLLSETTYYFYVRNVCAGDVNCSSPWDSCQFTMPVAMPAVINLQAYDIASNAFTAVWESDLANFADETAWEVACVATGETPDTWTEVSAPEHFALGLTPSTTYDFYVRAKDGANHSDSAMTTVTTTAVPADCKTIGDGTGTQNNIPCANYYNYGYSQQIFDASELQAGQITDIAFQYGSSYAMTKTNVKIYLGHTTQSEFTSGTDWIAAADLTEVYSGPFHCSGNGVFNTFTLTTPFNYNGTDNLVVAVHKENYGYEGGSYNFTFTYCSGSKTLYYQNDDTPCPVASPVSGSLGAYRNNIEFCFAPEACRSVTNLVVDNITTNRARAHWYPGADETEWQVINSTEQMTEDELAASTNYTTVTDNPFNMYFGLTKDMDYYFYVRGVCDEGETSKWKEIHYTTLPSCSAPATAVATSEADNSITFTVTSGEYGTEGTYDYRYWIVGSDDTTTVAGQGAEYTATGIAGCVDYAWEVRANCSGVDEGASRWVAGNDVHVCGAVTLPYNESFETVPMTYSGPGMIETICWNDLNAVEVGGSSTYPKYNASTSYATAGSKTLQFYSSNTTPIYVILPELADATQCQVKIDCAVENLEKSGRFQIGYLTDPTDATTFVPAFTDNPTAAYDMQTRIANLFNIPEGARIAICYTAGTTTNYYGYLDNVRIDTIPYYNVATAVAPEVTPAIGSVEVAYNESDTLTEGVFYGGTAPVFTAVPNEGIKFINWTNANNGDTLATVNPWTFSIEQDTSIVANFDTASYNLNVVVAPGHDIYGEVAGSGTFRYGRTVNLSATPMDHYSVVWPDSSTDNNRTIVMPAHDTTIVARFAIDKHTLTVAMNDSSKGVVTGTGVYDYGTFVDITAAPIDPVHMIFTGWSNGETDPAITIDLQHDSTVVANFIWDDHTVTTDVNDPSMGSVTGAGVYTHDDTARIIAIPAAHHIFVEWSNGLTNDTIDVRVVSDTALTATFDWDSHTITGLVNIDSMGTVEGSTTVKHGTEVTLTAVPAAHHHFVNWSNGVTTPTWTVIADNDSTVTAIFAIDQHTITAVPVDTVRGSVIGGGVFNYGDTATLIAVGKFPYQFSRWDDENLTELDTFKVKVLGDATYTAYFKYNEFDVIARSDDQTMGTVVGGGAFVYDTIVNITAIPNEHYHFVRWNNGSVDPTTTVVVRGDTMLTAYFAIDQHVVTANASDNALGTVAGAGTYNYGASVTLTATPSAHGVFAGWSDGTTANPYTFTLAGDTTVTANFSYDTHVIAATANDAAMGSITGTGTYAHGTLASLTAVANAHYHFVNWSNGLTANTFSILVDKDSTVVANFAIDQHVVTATSGNAVLGSVTGAGTYNYGASVTLTAIPSAHGVFAGWSDGTTANPYTFTLAGDTTVTANFSYDTHVIAATANDAAMGSITGTGTYAHGTLASLTAVANAHYHFVNWSNGLTANTFSILVDKDSTVTANFAIDQHVVTANVNNNALGTVAGAGAYNYGAIATLTATPAAHAVFTGWSNGLTDATINITVAGDTTVTANFIADSHVIAANADPTMGSVTGAGTYTHGTLATLTAVANEHYHFTGWSNGLTANTFSILVDKDSTVTANFAIDQHVVTAKVNNNALGTVAGAGTYNYGASVTLTAIPTAHGVFTGWSDGTTVNPYTFALTGDTTVTANFSYDTHTIAANVNSTTMGSVTGTGTYAHGTLASLTAVANAHYHFVNWSNGLTTNTFSILVDKDSTVTANFAIDQHVVTAKVNNNALGTVAGAGTYNYGALVTLTAIPTAHGVFTGWSDGTTVNPYTFTLAGDTTVTANFSYDTHTIAANVNSTTMGSVAGAGTYPHGTLATLVATPNAHYHFTGWDNGLTANTFSILVDKDSTVVANFAIDQHNVSAIVNDENMGSVIGTGAYNYNSTATLTAVPAANHHFVGWNTGNTNVTQAVNVTGDITLIANFAINRHTATILSNDESLGIVSGSGTYDYGTRITIIAAPNNAGIAFAGWSNGLTTPTATINLAKDTVITAMFVRNQYNVTLNVNDATMGSVEGTGTYAYGDNAVIKAIPADDCHSFVRWSDGETAATRTIAVDGNKTLTAIFAINKYTVTVASNDNAGGKAYCDNAGAKVSSMTVACGTMVDIYAEANQYYHFVEWSDGVTDAMRSIEVDGDMDLVARFEPNCGENADLPVVFLYNGLVMLDLDSVKERGYDPKPSQVKWYQVVGDVDNIEASFPADDQYVCDGYYLSLPTNNVGYGQYYAVVDVSNSPAALCHDKMKTVVVEYTNTNSQQNVQMAPTRVKSGEVITITGLVPDEKTTITVYDYTGKSVDVMQTEGLAIYDFTSYGVTGVYIVKVTSDSVNETFKFIVSK